MIVKGFCVRTCTRSEIWMRMTTSRKILVDARSVTFKPVLDTCYNSHCLPWTHYARCHDTCDIINLSFKLLTFLEIEASLNDACRCDISNEMVFAIFRGSHCSENDDESREAALTIHVNVDEVARHSTVRNSRIVTLFEQLSCSKQRWETTIWRDETSTEFAYLAPWDKSRTKTTTDSVSEVAWGRINWH